MRPSGVTKVTLPGECPGVWIARISSPGIPTSSWSSIAWAMGAEPGHGNPIAAACSAPRS